MLAFVGAGGFFFSRASQDPSGVNFLLYMLIALILLVPLPLLGYRLYALNNAVYILRREGLMIRWGLRREDIPLNSIEWMRPANEIGFRLPPLVALNAHSLAGARWLSWDRWNT